jgi:hypothetical protein
MQFGGVDGQARVESHQPARGPGGLGPKHATREPCRQNSGRRAEYGLQNQHHRLAVPCQPVHARGEQHVERARDRGDVDDPAAGVGVATARQQVVGDGLVLPGLGVEVGAEGHLGADASEQRQHKNPPERLQTEHGG